MTTPLPDEKTERLRTILISAIVVLAVVVVGLGAWAFLRPKPGSSAPRTFTPAEETTASTPATVSADASETTASQTASSADGGASDTDGTGTAPGIVRAAKVAFRLGNGIFVANEDGGSARQVVAQVADGVSLALSPDGATLALVSGGTAKSLELIDVASGGIVQVPNATDLPDWSPDSTWIAYTARNGSSLAVRRVNRDGSSDAMLAVPGADPKISPDGGRVAYSIDDPPNAADPLKVVDIAASKTTVVPKSGGAVHWGWAPDGSLYFVQPGKTAGSGTVSVADASLASSRVLGSIPATGEAGGPGELYVNPKGTYVVLTSVGDDGFSRMYVLDTKSGSIQSLATRHDAYPLGWTLDGKRVLFIEGNSYQGEATSLYRINPDGTQRLMVVGGAGS